MAPLSMEYVPTENARYGFNVPTEPLQTMRRPFVEMNYLQPTQTSRIHGEKPYEYERAEAYIDGMSEVQSLREGDLYHAYGFNPEFEYNGHPRQLGRTLPLEENPQTYLTPNTLQGSLVRSNGDAMSDINSREREVDSDDSVIVVKPSAKRRKEKGKDGSRAVEDAQSAT